MTDENPLRDRRVRGLIGLSGAAVVALVAILFLEGTLRWIVLGVALVDAIVTPWILGQAVDNPEGTAENDYGVST